MKYCIGCIYLQYSDKDVAIGSSQTGSWTVEEASLKCARGHWQEYLEPGAVTFDLAKAMEAAETCPDFKERPAP